MMRKLMTTVLLLTIAAAFLYAGGSKEESAKKEQQSTRQEETAGDTASETGTEAAKKAGGAISSVNPNRIAKVNDENISMAELNAETEKYSRQYESQGQKLTEDQLHRLRVNVLQTLINQKLLLQEFDESGLEMEPGMVEQQIAGYKSQFGSDEEYRSALSQNGLTEAELREAVTAQSKIQLLINESVKDVSLEEGEAETYFSEHQNEFAQPEEVRASHILIKADQNSTQEEKDEALARMKAIQEEIEGGADFTETAMEKSEGPSSVQGGDLGYFQRGQMVKPFEDAVWALATGEVSDIVETQFGYHLIKKTGYREEGSASFEDVSGNIENQLLQQKQQKAFENYLLALRDESDIEIFAPELRLD